VGNYLPNSQGNILINTTLQDKGINGSQLTELGTITYNNAPNRLIIMKDFTLSRSFQVDLVN